MVRTKLLTLRSNRSCPNPPHEKTRSRKPRKGPCFGFACNNTPLASLHDFPSMDQVAINRKFSAEHPILLPYLYGTTLLNPISRIPLVGGPILRIDTKTYHSGITPLETAFNKSLPWMHQNKGFRVPLRGFYEGLSTREEPVRERTLALFTRALPQQFTYLFG